MNTPIKKWIEKQPVKTQQWIWFVLLWCWGLLSVTVLTYPLKMLIRFMK